ncbi:Pro-corazonin [Orchesella cincta]|uniref:Pro-corazonin n=1 Tax=Orchesella cincta TaxID=48709 RepID=A0A1D2MKU2_ORCCI|nr:Pro-corazonin [Orchesella cincta]
MAIRGDSISSSLPFPLGKSSYSRKFSRTYMSWTALCVLSLYIIATAHAQTFQYSRGWTNGKRSGPTGGAPAVGLVDLENAYLAPEASDLGLTFPGHIQMNLSPQARLRTLDYNQYLARKLGVGSTGNLNTRKQPLWFGTIMGMDTADSSAPASQTASGSSSSNPSGTSTDF